MGDFFVFFIGFLAIFGNILYTIIRYAFVKAVRHRMRDGWTHMVYWWKEVREMDQEKVVDNNSLPARGVEFYLSDDATEVHACLKDTTQAFDKKKNCVVIGRN